MIGAPKPDRPAVAAIKEIVLNALAVDAATGEIDPTAPFMVNSSRPGFRHSRPYHEEPEDIAQFRPGEHQPRFEAE